jgi:sulfur carrier protein
MNLRINGKDSAIPDGQTIKDYLASRNLDPAAVVIEVNEAIVPKDQWAAATLKEGDRLEIVSFVGGG